MRNQLSNRWVLFSLSLALASLLVLAAASSSGVAQEPSQAGASVAEQRTVPVAEKEPIPTRDLWDIIKDGGLLMIPLGVCSLLLVTLIFERTISLRRGRIIPRPFVRRFLEQIRAGELDREGALQLCEENGSPVSTVFAGAVRKWGRPGVEVEQAIIDSGERATNGLRKYLRIFNGIATISPLLGLLGTVVGMIRAFNAIATSDAMGRPELLASGISQALLTTAAGLSIAIPALIFYMYFVSRVDRLIIDIDALAQQLVNVISAEELETSKKPSSSKSRRNSKKEVA